MMLQSYLCLGGVEIANDARAFAYIEAIGIPGAAVSTACPCSAYDAGYTTPLQDPAPWYEPTRPESADFLGFVAMPAALGDAYARGVKQSGNGGGFLAPLRLKARNVVVSGSLFATSAEGMAYGERWMMEVLKGSPCGAGCPEDNLVILPACPESATYDSDRYFRTLVSVGVTDGPIFASRGELPECLIQQVSFTLTANKPWLYFPADRCLDAQAITGTLSCALTTPEWMGDGTFVIEVENIDTTAVTDIVITGQISLDGTCPVSGAGTSVPPSFTYTIPTLAPEDRIVIDGARRQAHLYDASAKSSFSALPSMEWEGPFPWPDVGPCTTMCLTITTATGDATATVDAYLREI